MACPGCSNLYWEPQYQKLDHHPDCPSLKAQPVAPALPPELLEFIEHDGTNMMTGQELVCVLLRCESCSQLIINTAPIYSALGAYLYLACPRCGPTGMTCRIQPAPSPGASPPQSSPQSPHPQKHSSKP